jgi:4-hydroxy-tetrahydrodipicolinate reductase
MQKLKISLIGYGRMGKAVEKICIQRGHQIHQIIDSENDWKNKGTFLKDSDVAIEFSLPEKTVENIHHCFTAQLPVVVGTTGWDAQKTEIETLCLAKGHTLFHAPNFSYGMNMVFKLNQLLAKMTQKTAYMADLHEIHHMHKKDAPSGTALKLAHDFIRLNGRYNKWAFPENASFDSLVIRCLREGEVPGTHEIRLDSPEDEIRLQHRAKGREGFALGAVMAAEFLFGKTGVFTMDDLINERLKSAL